MRNLAVSIEQWISISILESIWSLVIIWYSEKSQVNFRFLSFMNSHATVVVNLSFDQDMTVHKKTVMQAFAVSTHLLCTGDLWSSSAGLSSFVVWPPGLVVAEPVVDRVYRFRLRYDKRCVSTCSRHNSNFLSSYCFISLATDRYFLLT